MLVVDVLKLHMALNLGQKFVVDFDITLRSSSNQDVIAVLHFVVSKFIDLSVVGTAKHLELELFKRSALFISVFRAQIDNNIGFTQVDEHVVFQNRWPFVHLSEDSEPDAKILDEVIFSLGVKPDLEVSALMLSSFRSSGWNNVVIYNNNLLLIIANAAVLMHVHRQY